MLKFKYLITLLLFVVTSTSLWAHQQKEAYTTMLFNERTGNLEVSHRFYVHDAEHALAKALKKKADLTLNAESMQEFADYIRASFQVKTADDEVLEFTTVGQEIDGKYFWVYQEVPLASLGGNASIFKINMTALQEVWPKQVNHINVEKDGKVRSVRLRKNAQWQVVDLDAEDEHSHSH